MSADAAVQAERERCSAILELAATVEGRGAAAARTAANMIRAGIDLAVAFEKFSNMASRTGESQLLAEAASRLGIGRTSRPAASASASTQNEPEPADITGVRDVYGDGSWLMFEGRKPTSTAA